MGQPEPPFPSKIAETFRTLEAARERPTIAKHVSIQVRADMIVGIPKEVKSDEYRVSMVPVGVEELTKAGHKVLVQSNAGIGSGIADDQYAACGAEIIDTAAPVWKRSDLIIKVKEPMADEWPLMKAGQTVFTYFHFAADEKLTKACLKSGITAVAYETIKDLKGTLPLLTPMSEVAGRMSIQEGAKYLERPQEGRGILLSGVPGVAPATVMVLGGGVVGANAAKTAAGLGANVYILDVNLDRLRYLDDVMPKNVTTLFSNRHNILDLLPWCDLVIGAVLIPGAKAPHLIRREDLKKLPPRSVVIDVAIDQGGCLETSRPTTHAKPIYIIEDIVHYCVTNMPGAVGRTSTYALTNVTLPYALQLANKGPDKAVKENLALLAGLNIRDGKITNQAVAETFGMELSMT
jgi:alanine dehydrogenase